MPAGPKDRQTSHTQL